MHTDDEFVGGAIVGLTYGNGKYLAVSDLEYVYTSLDGISWQPHGKISPYTITDLAFGNGEFVAVTIEGRIYQSKDGLIWQQQPVQFLSLDRVIYGNGTFLAHGQNTVIATRDRTAWEYATVVKSTPGTNFYQVIYAGARFWALELHNELMSSFDGLTWQSHGPPIFQRLKTLAYANGRFISTKAAIYRSPPIAFLSAQPSVEGFTLSLLGEKGGKYEIQASDDLSNSSGWAPIRNWTLLEEFESWKPPPGLAHRFYRTVTAAD